MEEVNLLPLLMMLIVPAVPIQGAHDFDAYEARADWTVPAEEVAAIGKLCEFKAEGATALYGTGDDDKWALQVDLKDALQNAEEDEFSTAEIWRAVDGQEIFSLWSVSADTGTEVEMMGCLAADHTLRRVVVTSSRTSLENGHLEFRYNTDTEFSANGQPLHKTSGFITYEGLPAIGPRLDIMDAVAIAAPLDPKATAQDIVEIEAKIRSVNATQK